MKASCLVLSLALLALVVAPRSASADEIFNTALAAPGVYFGSGNVNSGFTVLDTTNTDGSTLELALEAVTRFVGPITPTTNDYTAAASSGPRASWDFVFSVNTGTDPLSAYTYSLVVENDNTHTSYSFNPTLLPDNAQVGSFACSACAFNSANNGFQNSENLGFSFLAGPLGFSASAPDTYTITLSADPVNGINTDPSVSINVNAETPEPATWALMGGGLLVLGFAAFRRKRFAIHTA